MPDDKPSTITQDKLCALTTLTPERLAELVKAGHCPKPTANGYPQIAALQSLFKYLVAVEAATGEQRLGLPVNVHWKRVCEWTKLSHTRLRQLVGLGYLPAIVNGVYELDSVLNGLFRYYRDIADRRNLSQQNEQELKTKRQRELLDIQIAKERAEVIAMPLVERSWEGIILIIRQKMLSIATKVAPRLPFCKSQVEMENEIHREVVEALTELAKPQLYSEIVEQSRRAVADLAANHADDPPADAPAETEYSGVG